MLTSAIRSGWEVRQHRRWPDLVAAALLLLACAAFMFLDHRTPPIILWDESRLAVNALEMHLRGWSLVTTYGFVPDLWNTKPPLMIWLMNASMTLFGPSELALRLPSMIAALATLLVVFVFVRRVTYSLGTAALAVLLLSASLAFYGPHGARSGDYDALLCFFTTSYLSLLFFAVHRRRPETKLLVAIGVLVAGAALTKTVAGLVPGAGVALYLLVSRRLRRGFATPRYVAMVIAALAPLALFYVVREQLAPGYLKAVWFNDFAGRYHDQLGPLHRSPWFFVKELTGDWMFSAGPLALLAPLGVATSKGKARQALLFALCCAASELVLISVPATRLIQYMLPVLPWLAIATAITAADQLRRIFPEGGGRPRANVSAAIAAMIVVAIGIVAVKSRYEVLPRETFYAEGGYGALFETVHDGGIERLTVIEPGMDVSGIKAYAPVLRFYTLLWNERGMTIDRAARLPASLPQEGALASCDARLSQALVAMGGERVGLQYCAFVPARR